MIGPVGGVIAVGMASAMGVYLFWQVWRRRARPEPPAPEPPLVRVQLKCPDCGTTSSNFRMMEASTQWLTVFEGRRVAVEETCGWRVACQRCPCVYHVDPDGTIFKPHPLSIPQVPPRMSQSVQRRLEQQAGAQHDLGDDEELDDFPVGRERPRT